MPECPLLVVDDDPSILGLLADLLADEGYPVRTATNGAEALEAVEWACPRVVLLDMRMPVLDGWGFARAVAERGTPLTIVVMTAAQDARAWAREIGAQGYVAKPFEVPDLLDAVERACAAAA